MSRQRGYGYHPSNPKINIFVDRRYECSTNWAQTCKQAVEKFLEKRDRVLYEGRVTAHIDHSK